MAAFKLEHFDYDFLSGNWGGPKGAAYNTVFEDLREAGLVSFEGKPTPAGEAAMAAYRERLWTI